MNLQGLKVIKPGILTLLQDLGRFEHQHIGLSPGGAADEQAFLWANRLLDNPPNSPALEICIGGLQLEALTQTAIAITGAEADAQINEQPIANWQSHILQPGDRLCFGHARSGTRCYLAVKKGFQVTPSFGSVATVMRETIGGLHGDGSPLKTDDILPCAESNHAIQTRVPPLFIPDYQRPLIISTVVAEPAHTEASTLEALFHHTYRISAQSNSMGVRLEGEPIPSEVTGFISEGIAYGTIQLPPDGLPIVLLKDRQTIGGYPKLGTVFALDAFLLAQQRPHTEIRFSRMTLDEAQEKLRYFYHFFRV